MGPFNVTVTNIYRILIICFVIFMHYTKNSELGINIDADIIIFYTLLGIYALIFSLVTVNKWTSYAELISVLMIIHFYEHNILYALLILPVVSIVATRASKIDLSIFTLLIALFLYWGDFPIQMIIIISFAAYMIMEIFHSKFDQIEVLQNKLYQTKKTLEKKQIELGDKEREIEITSNMFVHSKYLNETIEVEALMQLIVDSSKSFFNAEYSCLYIKKDNAFVLEKSSGDPKRFEVMNKLAFSESENIIIENKLLRLTIDYEGSPWGIIAVYGKKSKVGETNQYVPFPFTEEDFEVLSVYLKMAMSPIKHANLLKTMNYLANNDFLTGIPNRRHFVDKFNYLKKIAQRGRDLTVMVMDIDLFKTFNDTYGHDVGDAVLKEVAETIKYTIREIDVVGRIGGEEFGVILLGAEGNEELVAERIRERVGKIPFQRKITVSIGISRFNKDGVTWEELYKKADIALYQAKENGRNQVVVYKEGMEGEDGVK